jgi:hypothetical protein
MDGIKSASGGNCDSCHDYDTTGGGTTWGKNSISIGGYGAHAKHIEHLKTVNSAVLSAATDTFGGAAFVKVCGVCHTVTASNHTPGSGTRSINFADGSTAYRFSTSATLIYNGVVGVSSLTTPKTCSNVNCHFQDAPMWSTD